MTYDQCLNDMQSSDSPLPKVTHDLLLKLQECSYIHAHTQTCDCILGTQQLAHFYGPLQQPMVTLLQFATFFAGGIYFQFCSKKYPLEKMDLFNNLGVHLTTATKKVEKLGLAM